MANWIIPCNPRYYDIVGAYTALSSIDWRQSARNIEVGDIVYIYVGKPIQAILYKTCVSMTNISGKHADFSDARFILTNDLGVYARYMRLDLIRKYPPKALTYEVLKRHGLNGSIQGPRHTDEIIQSVIDATKSTPK